MIRPRILATALLSAAVAFSAACNKKSKSSGGGSGGGLVVAMGDSMTNGQCVPDGTPYPEIMARMSGRQVVNTGVCGQTAIGGAGRVQSRLAANNPETLTVLYGSNDIIFGLSPSMSITALREIITAAQAKNVRVIIATLPPVYDSHAQFGGGIAALNRSIRALAAETGVGLADLGKEFHMRRELIQADGLHPTAAGNQVIAAAFADQL